MRGGASVFKHASPAVGGSLESIATAKAGIMKAGRPVVLSPQPEPAAEAVLLQHAEELGCESVRASAALQLHHQASQQGLAAQLAKGQWQKPFDRRLTPAPFGENSGRQLHLGACDIFCLACASQALPHAVPGVVLRVCVLLALLTLLQAEAVLRSHPCCLHM